jgi:hypothetical protein
MSKMNNSIKYGNKSLWEVEHLDQSNIVSMYSSTFLCVVGLFGNMLSMIVLIHARKRTPKFNSANSLLIFTFTNLLQLILHFYMNTLNRLIYNFDLEDTFLLSFSQFDSNWLICKLCSYLKFAVRFLNLSVMFYFCTKRLSLIYSLFEAFKLKTKNYLFNLLIVISFILPLYLVVFCDTIAVSNDYMLPRRLNATSSPKFSLNTLTPILKNTYCSIRRQNESLFFKLHALTHFVIICVYFFVSISLMAMIFRLKTRLRSCIAQPNENAHSLLASRRLDRSLSIQSPKNFPNTNMLSTLAVSFVLFNSPYYLGLFLLAVNKNTFKLTHQEELARRINCKIYLIIAEIFQLVNVSITGLLFFISGKRFRFHLNSLLNQISIAYSNICTRKKAKNIPRKI